MNHKGNIEEFLDIWFKSEHKINEDIIEFIRELKDKNIIVSIATNQKEYRTQYIAGKMEFGKHFQHIFSSARIGHMKPSRDFLHMCKKV